MTQVELADATGLSTATVSIIVNELVAAGIVTTTQVTRSGRRAFQVTLSRGLGLVAGIHFSTRALRVALADPSGTIVARQRLPLPPDHRHDTDMDRAAQLVSDMLESIGAPPGELLGAGLGICAPYNAETDMLSVPGLLRGWDEVRLAESMSRRLGKQVVVDNDANLAMLGESRHGVAREASSAVFVSIGYGIGAGIMANGELLRGHDGTAGEIGHVRVSENGELCRCGNRGCLEVMVNSTAIVHSLRHTVGNVTLRDVITMARQGDIGCSRVISDAAHYVGAALSSLCNLINPELIVIGGELADAGAVLLAPLEAAIERNSLRNPLNPPQVQLSALGDDAAVHGAVAFAFDSISLPITAVEASA
jgi:predicted NBD/HSP70 family sugar kinase